MHHSSPTELEPSVHIPASREIVHSLFHSQSPLDIPRVLAPSQLPADSLPSNGLAPAGLSSLGLCRGLTRHLACPLHEEKFEPSHSLVSSPGSSPVFPRAKDAMADAPLATNKHLHRRWCGGVASKDQRVRLFAKGVVKSLDLLGEQ